MNLMKKLWNILHNISDKLRLPDLPGWLIVLLVVLLVLRIPSFFEPYYYGDEMIYLSLGEAVRQGKTLYLSIHDNKPPLLYLVAAAAGNVFWFKVILGFWMLVTTVIFWKFTKVLFPKKKSLHTVAAIIFGLLTTLPTLEGNIANSELFMIAPTLLAFMVLLTKKLNFKNIFWAGILFSFSTMFKVPAAFDVPAIVFFWLILGGLKLKNIKEVVKNTFYLALGYLFPIAITFVWYFFKGAFGEYLIAAYLQNVGYLSSFRPGDVVEPFFVRNMPLLIRGGLVGLGIGVVALFKKKLSKQFIFLTIWLFLTLFAVTLSERPYPHYLVQSVPAISVMFAMLFTQKSFEQSLVIIPLSIFFFVPVHFNFWKYSTGTYYMRFINFATGQTNKDTYITSFDQNALRNYEIANFINASTKRTDPIFVWGDSSTIYALSRRLPPIRYVAGYHIADFSSMEETVETLKKTPPELIVILPNSPDARGLYDFMEGKYTQVETINGSDIWTLISPEVSN